MENRVYPSPQPPTDKVEPLSLFAQHFNTNYTPTPSDITSIKGLIDQRQAVVDGIDGEIAELDRRRRELVESKQTHAEYIDAHRGLISPARRLHPDALLAIFLTLVSESRSELPIRRGAVIPAVVISQVCSQWRDLAMRSPLLWSYIDVPLPSIPIYPGTTAAQGDLDRFQAGLSQWRHSMDLLSTRVDSLVERSQDCPLHISLCANDPQGEPTTTEEEAIHAEFLARAVKPLMAIAKKGRSGWKTLRIHLRMAWCASPLISLLVFLKVNGQGVQRLELDVAYECPGSTPKEIWEEIEGAIDLQEAPITSLTIRIPYADICRFDVRWDLLTSLSTGSPNSHAYFGPQEATNILYFTPNLVQCTIKFLDDVRQPFPRKQTLSLRNLQDLTFRGSPARAEFVALLDTPSLTRLSAVHNSCPAQDEDHSAIVELVRHYGAQLTDVSLAYSSLTQSAFSFVLERLVAVTSLSLYPKDDAPVSINLQIGNQSTGRDEPLETHLDATLLQRLTPRWDDVSTEAPVPDFICPKLQTLICVFGDERKEETKEAIVSLIEARRKGASVKEGSVGSLGKVDATFYVGPVDKMLKDLDSRGVDTFGVSFKARYAAPHLTPCLYKLPIPGIGTISISMDHNHSH